MKKVKLREFQDHASKYIEELPIILTKYYRDKALVLPKEEIKKYRRRKKKV